MNVAILLSGGIGRRLGGEIPKQYIEVAGHPVIYYTMKNILEAKSIDALVIVAEEVWENYILNIYSEICENDKMKELVFALPGRNRQESIIHGMEVCEKFNQETTYVMVHDAVRPFLNSKMIDDYFAQMSNANTGEANAKCYEGLLPVLPMKDTVYLSNDGCGISSLIDRSKVFAGQAPEIFDFHKYYDANLALSDDELMRINGSTEPAVMAGMKILMVPGDEKNFKITTIEDLKRFESIVKGTDA